MAETELQLSRNARCVLPLQALVGRDAMHQPSHQVAVQRQDLVGASEVHGLTMGV